MAVTTEQTSKSWLKQRDSLVIDLINKEKDLLKIPVFSLESFLNTIKQNMSLSLFSLSFEYQGWITTDVLSQNMPKEPYIQSFVLDSVENSELFVIYSKSDLQAITTGVFDSLNTNAFFYDENKLLGFHYYFFAEVCKTLQALKWIPSLTVKMDKELVREHDFTGNFFCLKLRGNCNNNFFSLQILMPEICWNNFFAFAKKNHFSFELSTMNPLFPLLFSLELGYSSVSTEDFLKLRSGDFLLLDSCFFDVHAKEDSGAFLSVSGKKLFGGRFPHQSPGDYKITNYSNIDMAMPEEKKDEKTVKDVKNNENAEKEALAKVSVNIIIEAGRYSITLEEFTKLAPGSVLSLGVLPEQGVNLVVNEALIGKGELISLGDVLGVRITELL